MHNFFITIKKGGQVFGKFEKFEINLDTSTNIVKQAEEITNSILDTFEIPETTRNNFSWKVYRNQGRGFGMVAKSKNWEDK